MFSSFPSVKNRQFSAPALDAVYDSYKTRTAQSRREARVLPIRVIRVIRGELFLLFLAEFLEARVTAKRVEHGIETEQRSSEGGAFKEGAFVRYRQKFP